MILSSIVNNDEFTTEKNDNQQVNAVRLNNIRMYSKQFCLECDEHILPEYQFQYSGMRFCSNCEEKIAIKRCFLSSYKRRFNRNRNQT